MSEKFLSRLGGLIEEIIRKGIHVASGVLMAILYTLFQKNLLIFVHFFFLIAIWFLEVLRFKGMIQVPFLRDGEKKNIGSHAFFMLSTLISILLFDIQIAIASILILAIGDAASGIAQAVKGGPLDSVEVYKRGIKPLDMILIMFTVSFLVGYYMLDSFIMGIFGAIGATIADGVRLRIYGLTIDDNLTIPLYSGFLMSLGAIW
jgi:dolichol kinase